MRIALLTEGGYPYARSDGGVWCDRLVRGLSAHAYEVYALGRSPAGEAGGLVGLPPNVTGVRTLRLWGEAPAALPGTGTDRAAGRAGRARRRRFAEPFRELATALAGGDADEGLRVRRFADGLYGLAALAREKGGVPHLLRSDEALSALEAACRARGAAPVLHDIDVPGLLTAADGLERALRPMSAPWYEPEALGAADLCHAASGGSAALPGLLAKRFFGTPLLVTEYGVRLREALLEQRAAALPADVRALLVAFHRLLAGEVYRQAALVTHGTTHVRRWQERRGAERTRLRTVHPGLEAVPFARIAESSETDDRAGLTLVWVGGPEPAKDLVGLLHAFAALRREEPDSRLRILYAPGDVDGYLGQCRTLAAQLFPDEARDTVTVGESPVSFEEIGSPTAPQPADAYAAGDVVVLSSVVEGFPVTLVEAMFCGRGTVSTDVGAVREVIGGTGLVVPPRNPKALAEACLALLRDPERSARLGAAARERALALFTVERCVDAFHAIYLDVLAHCPVQRDPRRRTAGAPLPFAEPAESRVPGGWTAPSHVTAPAPVCAPVPAGGRPDGDRG